MDEITVEPVITELFVAGLARATSDYADICDPAQPERLVGRASRARVEDVEDAIVAAQSAFPEWSALPTHERSKILEPAIGSLALNRAMDSDLLSLEVGKIHHESIVDSIVLETRWKLTLDLADQVDVQHELEKIPGALESTVVQRQPLGVVTIVVPFNWPLAILGAALPHALLAGNTVIVKPPRTAPLATARVVSRIAAALPPGVLNVITGDDEQVRPLIDDPRIAKVSFTGSVAGGKHIMHLASRSLTRVTLELGGNDPAIFLADAPLDDAHLDRLFAAIFDTSGQICMNVKRIFVHESRREELVSGLAVRLENVRLGHGLDETTTMGPLHSAVQKEAFEALIAQAKSSGAEVHEFGEIPTGGLATGHFVRPALVIDPDPELDVVTHEQFGPVIPITTFTDEADAVRAANDTWAGLGASVWTASRESADRIARQMECGYVWINDHGATRLDLRAPFGGMKQSGFGREQGLAGIRDFQDTRAVARLAE
jgi:acyl-CoA reductase-like NAD-dependent aldehyde dehydrogenase